MAESISRNNYGNKDDEDYDRPQSNNKNMSSNNEKYNDPAILSCGSAKMENRIQYDREHLLQLRNSPLSRKRPEYILEGMSMRKLWCRTSDMVGGEERTVGSRSTNSSSHEYRSSTNGTSTAASTYLMPLFAVKRRPNETKSIRKADGTETTSSTTSTSTNNAPIRRSVFMSGPQLTSVGGGGRIGSGRIPARDSQWESRSEKEPIDQEFSFRPTGGLFNIRDRDRERNLSSESQQKLQQQHRASQLERERDRDYRDDRYDKRTYSRDYDRDKDRNNRMIGSSNNNNLGGGNMRFSSGSHNNDRRRMFSENRTEEPEWFSGGPTSQNDTIELRGFDEPEPDERKTDTNAENDDQVSLDNQSDNSNNNIDDCDVSGAEPESDDIEDAEIQSSTTNPIDEPNDTNNNDSNINSDKGFLDPSNNSADDFNFEDFLKMGLMSDMCQTDDEFKDSGVGESRFYRWFQRQSPTKENKSRRSSLQDDFNEGNQNDASVRPAEKYFAPISPAASTGSSHSLLEFIQLGKFDKTPKEDPNLVGAGRNIQSISIPNNVPGGVCSVEELEARMRTSGGKSHTEIRNQQQQPDMQAFKKLLSQMSGSDPGMMHREQQQHAMGQATGLMQMLSKNAQHTPYMNNQRPQPVNQNLQPPIQRQPQMDAMQNVIQIGQHLQQSRDEILKRPEAQMLIQSICNAEVTQNSLMQQLNNPASGTRHRETILAVLNFVSECAPRIPSPIMVSSVMQSQSGAPMLHGGGVPLPKPPTIQTNAPPNVGLNEQPNDVMQSHLLYQHHHQAAAAAAQKQLRVSPLPNGIPQRIPSPRELQFHTQSIMQSALIKKKLEEQRENFRKRQEMQQQQQQNHMNQSQNQSEAGNLMPSSTQTSTSSPAKQHHQHIASPTPLAFTPTSVLRKMTAEKDMDIMNNVGIVGGNKDINLKSVNLGQQMQIHQQHQQQQQQIRANQIKWNQFNQPPSKPMEVIPAGRPIVKGGGLPMQMASNVEFQQMRDQYLRKNNPQPTLSGGMQQSQQQLPNLSNLSQQQQMQHLLQHRQQQQLRANQIKWNQFNQPYQNQYQQMMNPHALNQQQKPSGSSGQSGNVLVNENHGMINFGREGGLSPTSNQLARWFSPELLAQASAGKLPSLNIGQALSLEEFERSIQHSSATVHN